jgi:hypothetical protein
MTIKSGYAVLALLTAAVLAAGVLLMPAGSSIEPA